MINTRYEIIKKLGEGRSTVYLCRDIEFPEKEYAIKILPPVKDNYEHEIFFKEFFTLQRLEHPGVIEAFEIGKVLHSDGEAGIELGSTFITMEYFEGEELLSSIKIRDEKNLKEIVKQICSVLYYLHQSKYIYYDLKPENILVSFKGKNPRIKLIDLGLAEYSPSSSDYEIKGTAYYIAPELLKKEKHNHSVDFYSLGIILYQIIYSQFPFNAKSELEIYKSAIEDVFDFPPSDGFTQEFLSVVKKSLEKDVEKRYSSALAIIKDLGFVLDVSLTEEFLPARVYSCREDAINTITKYCSDKSSSEVYTIKGFDGVGKTSLLRKIQELNNDAVIISEVKGKSAEQLIIYFLRQIIFSKTVFPNFLKEEKLTLLNLLRKSEREIIDELLATVALLTSKNKFILLLDDFNLYDSLASDFLVEIIPLLQVNSIKVIFAESSGHSFLSSRINNVKEITLGPFTQEEMILFIDESYSSDFPKEDIKNLISANADLIPGNIISFIKDLILFGVMKFSETGVIFSDEENKLSDLTETHYTIYDLRLANLSRRELTTAKIISALDIYIDLNLMSLLIGLPRVEMENIIVNLQLNNIIQKFSSGQTIIFTSEAIKKYIYASAENKKKLHLQIAKRFTEKLPSLNRLEEARHYELAGAYEKSFNITMDELNEVEKLSAYSYMQRILNHLLQFPLEKKLIDPVKIKLSEVYFKLNEFKSSIKIIESIQIPELNEEELIKIKTIEAGSLIGIGEYELAKKAIKNLLNRTNDAAEKKRLTVELAYAEFEQKNYTLAEENCNLILDNSELSNELNGRCYNLKGMLRVYKDNDLTSALKNFQMALKFFKEANLLNFVAAMENNIGNVCNILEDYRSAEEHWKMASQINQSIGNLNWDGILLQNIGVFYFNRQKPDLAINSYKKAHKIFLSLGNEINRGLILINLGEAYMKICEYEKSFSSLIEATEIFKHLGDFEELAEALFLLGKFYFLIGVKHRLNEIINSLKSYLSTHKLPSKHNLNYKYLKVLSLNNNESKTSTEELKLISEEYKKYDNKNNYLDSQFLLVLSLILEAKYTIALEEINQPYLIDFCSQNSILEAQREYFLGIISKNYESEKLLSPLVHFEKAYDLIKDESVTELTWKVMYEISQLYIERGNYTKAKRFVVYSRELIYFIAEKLESPQLRAAYLKNTERLETLKKLESFYPG